MSKVNNGIDTIARQVGNLFGAAYNTGTAAGSITGTSLTLTSTTGPSASSGGPPHNTGALIGCVIVMGQRYGIILQHTVGPPAALTIDRWYDPTAPGGAAGSAPTTANWVIVPGNAPAAQLGLSVATLTIAAAHAFLTNDASTVSEIWNSGGGLNRALGTYAHTVGTSTYTLTKTWTSTVSDPSSSTVHRVGVFVHAVDAAPSTTTTGMMVYETNLSADAIITNNASDQLTVTETVTIS